MPNVRIIAKGQRGDSLTKLKVNFTPTQSGTPWQDDTVNNAPYVFRSVPMGNREWNKLIGGTVAWNQLCNLPSYTGTIQGLDFDYGGQSIKISGTPLVTGQLATIKAFNDGTVSGHKYLLLIDDVGSNLQLRRTTEGLMIYGSTIFQANGNDSYMAVRARSTSVAIDYDSSIYTIDLTLALNPTLADYVYSLEQETSGSGIAWLKKYDLIDDAYHAYTAGSLESVNVSAHVMRDADNNIIETYPIDSSVTLRGILKTDENGNLYYYGDEYLPDGTVNRRLGIVDLGTLSWQPNGTDSVYASISGKLSGGQNIFVQGLVQVPSNTGVNDMPLGSVKAYSNNANIAVKVSGITDVNASTMLSGVYAIYERATPTTESADPFTNPQVCDPDGTEEWTDYGVSQGTRDYAVPVGHESTYAMAYPIEGVDSFTVTANDGTTHTYPVSIGTTIYKGTVDVLGETYVSEMTNIASYNGETIGEPWLSSLDEYAPGTTPTTGAQVVYTSTPTEGSVTVTGDPSTLSGISSVTSDKGQVEWSELAEITGKTTLTIIKP